MVCNQSYSLFWKALFIIKSLETDTFFEYAEIFIKTVLLLPPLLFSIISSGLPIVLIYFLKSEGCFQDIINSQLCIFFCEIELLH